MNVELNLRIEINVLLILSSGICMEGFISGLQIAEVRK